LMAQRNAIAQVIENAERIASLTFRRPDCMKFRTVRTCALFN
jgi:hypothetical protein